MSTTAAPLLAEAEQKLRAAIADPNDALPLLAHVLGQTPEFILSHPGHAVTGASHDQFQKLIAQRINGYSIAVLRGHCFFYGHRFIVTEDTLVPRPESEPLVGTALDLLAGRARTSVLDMGTGSGNLIISIASSRTSHIDTYWAADVSRRALAVAKKNAKALNTHVRFFHSNLFSDIPAKQFDCIIANLPYLTAEQLREPSIKKEPLGALWGGTRGIELYRVFFRQAPEYLAPDGMILMEIDPEQKNELLTEAHRYFPEAACTCLPDLSGTDRVIQILRWGPGGS